MKKNLFWLIGFAYTSLAHAQTGGTGGTNGSTQIPNPLGECKDLFCISGKIIKNLQYIAIPIVAIFIFYAAFLFVTAGGNEDRVKQARNTLLYTVVGYGLILVANMIAALINSILTG